MKPLVTFIFSILLTVSASSQLKNLGKKLENKVKQRIDRKVDESIDKGLDKTEESIEESVKGNDNQDAVKPGTSAGTAENVNSSNNANRVENTSEFQYSTKFDFVPGNKILVVESFEKDYVGDFPANWNTNGSGEIVRAGTNNEKWLKLKSESVYIPDLPSDLPEEYSVEFDLIADGITQKTTSAAYFNILLDDNNSFKRGKNFGQVKLSLCQYTPIGIQVDSEGEGQELISNRVKADLRTAVLNKPHISIAVNKKRFRLWVNEKKYLDIPRFLPEGKIKSLKFELIHLTEEKGENLFLGNLKIAEGGLDLRSKLLKEGKVSTNGILSKLVPMW